MKIERIELREIQLPLVAPFETSFGQTTERQIILVKVYSEGWSAGANARSAKIRFTTTNPPKARGQRFEIMSRR